MLNREPGHGSVTVTLPGQGSVDIGTGAQVLATGHGSVNTSTGAQVSATGHGSVNISIGAQVLATGHGSVNTSTGSQVSASGHGSVNISTGTGLRNHERVLFYFPLLQLFLRYSQRGSLRHLPLITISTLLPLSLNFSSEVFFFPSLFLSFFFQ